MVFFFFEKKIIIMVFIIKNLSWKLYVKGGWIDGTRESSSEPVFSFRSFNRKVNGTFVLSNFGHTANGLHAMMLCGFVQNMKLDPANYLNMHASNFTLSPMWTFWLLLMGFLISDCHFCRRKESKLGWIVCPHHVR